MPTLKFWYKPKYEDCLFQLLLDFGENNPDFSLFVRLHEWAFPFAINYEKDYKRFTFSVFCFHFILGWYCT